MLDTELYEKVLMRCVREGCDELPVVSGYASPEMCTQLVMDAGHAGRDLTIDLIVGMVGAEGITKTSHRAFQSIHGDAIGANGTLRVRYSRNGLGIHSKMLVWIRAGQPMEAWVGSANFTQTGFGLRDQPSRRFEVMTPVDPVDGLAYFARMAEEAVPIGGPGVLFVTEPTLRVPDHTDAVPPVPADPAESGIESSVLPLVALTTNSRTGTVRGDAHARAGLNWGQRPEHAREPNQAYVPVPAPVRDSDFFPPRGVVFRVTTDDGEVLHMSRAQQGGKALQTPQDNGMLGRYFRRRLGVPPGERITTEDLSRNGSRFVRFLRGTTPEGEYFYQMVYAAELEVEGRRIYGL